jgi:hypothetical protein
MVRRLKQDGNINFSVVRISFRDVLGPPGGDCPSTGRTITAYRFIIAPPLLLKPANKNMVPVITCFDLFLCIADRYRYRHHDRILLRQIAEVLLLMSLFLKSFLTSRSWSCQKEI